MFLAKKSALELLDFSITESQYKFVPPTDESRRTAIDDTFGKYDVHIDYMLRSQDEQHIALRLKVVINPEEENKDDVLAGYRLLVEGAAIFSLKEKELSDEELRNLINFSSISILVSNVRGYIANLTAYAPFGKYILPTIDVRSLISEKAKYWKEHHAQQENSEQ